MSFSVLKSKTLAILPHCLSILASLLLTPVVLSMFAVLFCIRLILSIFLRFSTHSAVQVIQPMDAFQVWDTPHNRLETYTVLILQGDGNLGKIRTAFSQKVIQNNLYEKLRARIVKIFGFYCWEILSPAEFRVDNHVKLVEDKDANKNGIENETGFGETQLFQLLSEFYDNPMPLDKPRWEVWVVPIYSCESISNQTQDKLHYAIILRVHHSIMDGISTYLLLTRALADLGPITASASMPIDPLQRPRNTPVTFTKKLWTYLKLLLVWPRLLHGSVTVPAESNCFHGGVPLSSKKVLRWTDHFRIETLKKIRRHNFSTTAVLNAAVAGAFRRLAQTKGLSAPEEITAVTSIPMLPYPDCRPRNRFSGAFFPLSVGGGKNSLDRLERTDATIKAITGSGLVLFNSLLLQFIGTLPAAWSQNVTDSRELTVLTSNIPGPSMAGEFFDGDKLLDVAGFLPIKNKTGLAFCFVSYCGNIRASIVADATIVASEQDVDLLKEYFLQEIKQMEKDAEFRNLNGNAIQVCDSTWVEFEA